MTKTIVVAATLLGLGALALTSQRRAARLEQRLASERAEWSTERTELEALAGTPLRPPSAPAATATALTPREILARYGYSEQDLRRLRKLGVIPA